MFHRVRSLRRGISGIAPLLGGSTVLVVASVLATQSSSTPAPLTAPSSSAVASFPSSASPSSAYASASSTSASALRSMLIRAANATYCDNTATEEEISTPQKEGVEEVEDLSDLDDEAWDKAKSGCGFCKFFLESPCASEFRNWSRCVDKCKKTDADFKEVCQEFTTALMQCSAASDYFSQPPEEAEAEAEAEVGSEAKTASESEVLTELGTGAEAEAEVATASADTSSNSSNNSSSNTNSSSSSSSSTNHNNSTAAAAQAPVDGENKSSSSKATQVFPP